MIKRTAILPPKLTRPSAARALIRKRLFRKLDAGLKKKAVWISGPAGAGKSTLIASYIEASKLSSLWYQMDATDGIPSAFFHFIGLGARQLAPRKKPLPDFTPEYFSNLSAFTKNFFSELFLRMPGPSVLVLDNFQEILASDNIPGIICDAMEVVPAGSSIIIVSRTAVPKKLARAHANQCMDTIGWEDLRLTPGESKSIARVWGYGKPVEGLFNHLQGKAQGWAAGLFLMLERARLSGDTAEHIKKTTGDAVFNYLMTEIFDKMDAATRDFLLKTAHLPSLPVDMTSRLAKNKDAADILERLYSNHFFTDKRVDKEPVFHFHPLFRDFLISRAKKEFSADYLCKLKVSAALLLEERGMFEDAGWLFKEAGDVEGLKRLILEHGDTLIRQGRFAMLESWIAGIPEKTLAQSPWLLSNIGRCRTPFNAAQARSYFEDAFALFKAQRDYAGAFLSWADIVDTFMYEWMNFKPLDRWIKEFEVLKGLCREMPSPEIEQRITSCMFGALSLYQPQHPDIKAWAERANRMVRDPRDMGFRFIGGFSLLFYYFWTGDSAKAKILIDEILPMIKRADSSPLMRLMWYRAIAVNKWLTGEYMSALALVDEGLSLAKKTGIHLLDNRLLGQGVYSAQAIGDMVLAEAYFNRFSSEGRAGGFDDTYYHHLASLVALNRGDLVSAVEHGKECDRLSTESGALFNHLPGYFVLTVIYIEMGKFDDIEQRLDVIRKSAIDLDSLLYEYAALVLEALFAMKKNETQTCVERLSKALTFGREHGYKCFLLLPRTSAKLLCAMALEAGIETEYVADLIRRTELTADASMIGIEEWPWCIKIFTLGRFEILKHGKPLAFSRKAQKKPMQLLKAIIAFGGMDVEHNLLAHTLWPDVDGDMAYRSLVITLHRLRELIGADTVQFKNGQISLDTGRCWVDVWGFDYFLKASDKARETGQLDRKAYLIEKAIALYRGSFLGWDDNLPCAVSYAERLRHKFITSTERAAGLLEKAGRCDMAIDLYNKGLQADESIEAFYRNLMICHKKNGNRTEALRVYERCKSHLAKSMGIEPCEKTESVFKSLR